MADRDRNRNTDRRNNRDDRKARDNRRGDKNNPNMEVAEEFDARNARRIKGNRMETAGDLGVKRDQDRNRDDDECCDDDR